MSGLTMEDKQTATALVAVCQMNSTSDVDRNLGICKDLVKKAKTRGAKVKFTENTLIYKPVQVQLGNPLPPWGMLSSGKGN